MLIMKFGGTSMGSPSRIREVASIIAGKNGCVIAVVSAMSGTTNMLLSIGDMLRTGHRAEAEEAISQLKAKYVNVVDELLEKVDCHTRAMQRVNTIFDSLASFLDEDVITDYEERQIVAMGEQLSTKLLTECMSESGHAVAEWSALDFMRTNHLGVVDMTYLHDRLSERLQKSDSPDIIVTQGFICTNAYGETDNLKRGGSDYTATLISAAIDADCCEIWTDVSGVHTCDPRFVNNTHTIPHLHFDEAIMLAYHGAKILHPTCVAPCKAHGVPIRLLNTMRPEDEGTLIDNAHEFCGLKGMAVKDGIAVAILKWNTFTAGDYRREVWQHVTHFNGECYMLNVTHTHLMICMEADRHAQTLAAALKKYGDVVIRTDLTLLTLVGESEDCHQTTAMSKVISALHPYETCASWTGVADNAMWLLVETCNKNTVLQQLNEALF